MGMGELLRKKCKEEHPDPHPRSIKIVKKIERSQVVALNKSMEKINEQNQRERAAGEQEAWEEFISPRSFKGTNQNNPVNITDENTMVEESATLDKGKSLVLTTQKRR